MSENDSIHCPVDFFFSPLLLPPKLYHTRTFSVVFSFNFASIQFHLLYLSRNTSNLDPLNILFWFSRIAVSSLISYTFLTMNLDQEQEVTICSRVVTLIQSLVGSHGLYLYRCLVNPVLPDVRIPEQEDRRLPRQCNSQKRGSLLLTRARAPAARPTQWYRVREP